MKAKEMAAALNAVNGIEARLRTMYDLAIECIHETRDLAVKRGVKTDSAMKAVIREIDDKWRSFARQCEGVPLDGFKKCLHATVPISKELFT